MAAFIWLARTIRTVGEEQHVCFDDAGAIVGYDEVARGGGLRVWRGLGGG